MSWQFNSKFCAWGGESRFIQRQHRLSCAENSYCAWLIILWPPFHIMDVHIIINWISTWRSHSTSGVLKVVRDRTESQPVWVMSQFCNINWIYIWHKKSSQWYSNKIFFAWRMLDKHLSFYVITTLMCSKTKIDHQHLYSRSSNGYK